MGIMIRFAAPAAAALALAAAAPAAAEQWRAIAIDDSTALGMAVAYADAATIARTGDEIAFDYQVRFSRPPATFDRLVGRMRLDCAGRRWGSDHSAHYLGATRGAEFGPRALTPVRPDTNGSVILENMCGGRFLSGPIDPAEHSWQVFGGR
ncbi:MAG: hypothetical protein QOI38_168 [Sphingomonadales bacterium]|jgi:hypothetical protein|nr:hypothetical protein [Sphingomonadales bacterium]